MYRWVSQCPIPDDDKPPKDGDLPTTDKINPSGINQRIQMLFTEQLYTDVTFLINCDNQRQQTLRAHKAILATGSDLFRKKFFEGKKDTGPAVIQMKNVPYAILKNVIEFLYTDEIVFENEKSVIGLLLVALQFEIQSLVDKCKSYIDSIELTENNVCFKFQLSEEVSLAPLKERCAKFIQENTANVIRSKDFQSVNATTVLFICEMEKLNLYSEKQLLDCILGWATAQPNSEKEQLRSLVEPFLKHIRFLTLTAAEFNEFVQSNPSVLTTTEVSSILISLTNRRTVFNLPPFCNNTDSRCNRQPFCDKRPFQPNKYIYIPLKSCPETQLLSNLTCVLELKCLSGRHRIKHLQLSFDESITELREMIDIVIKVSVEPNKYHFKEYIKMENTNDCVVNFSRSILVQRGNTIKFNAVIKDVKNSKFLQFDDSNLGLSKAPFECKLASEPNENRLFFISKVIYHSFNRENMR